MVMRARWRSFELPTRIVAERDSLTSTFGKFIAEPFERGFGITIGNSLRRVLLSSLEGAAVTSIKIDGVLHEFTAIPGIVEDVTDIVLNIKQLLVKVRTEEPRKLKLEVKRKGAVTAKDFQADAMVEIMNPDLHICTLSEETRFAMEIEVRKGRGYVTAEENETEDREIGVIPIDSIFSPVKRVRYRTENTRVGQLTDYDKLILEIWTDGTLSPELALVEAGKIMRKHLIPFVSYFEPGEPLEAEAPEEEDALAGSADRPTNGGEEGVKLAAAAVEGGAKPDLKTLLAKPIMDLDLSVRSRNCLESVNIKTIGDLVSHNDEDLLKIRNFGKTCHKEVEKKLQSLGLSLGMDVGAAKSE